MSQLTALRGFLLCGIGRRDPGRAWWTLRSREMGMRVQGAQGSSSTKQSAREETAAWRGNPGDVEDVPWSIQQSSDHYMHVKILPLARGKSNLTGLDKKHPVLTKGQECRLFPLVSLEKKSNFLGHWAEYSGMLCLSSGKNLDTYRILYQIHFTN